MGQPKLNYSIHRNSQNQGNTHPDDRELNHSFFLNRINVNKPTRILLAPKSIKKELNLLGDASRHEKGVCFLVIAPRIWCIGELAYEIPLSWELDSYPEFLEIMNVASKNWRKIGTFKDWASCLRGPLPNPITREKFKVVLRCFRWIPRRLETVFPATQPIHHPHKP